MADQNFMDLASKTASGIAGTDYMMLVNDSEAYKALVNDVAEAILSKLTSKSFSGLETTAKNVIGALNELNSKKIANVANVGYQSVSVDDITDTFAILQVTSITDIPSDIKSNLGEWVLVSTFKKNSGTGVQFITSLFMLSSGNAKIYKRHLASGIWSNFQLIN